MAETNGSPQQDSLTKSLVRWLFRERNVSKKNLLVNSYIFDFDKKVSPNNYLVDAKIESSLLEDESRSDNLG